MFLNKKPNNKGGNKTNAKNLSQRKQKVENWIHFFNIDPNLWSDLGYATHQKHSYNNIFHFLEIQFPSERLKFVPWHVIDFCDANLYFFEFFCLLFFWYLSNWNWLISCHGDFSSTRRWECLKKRRQPPLFQQRSKRRQQDKLLNCRGGAHCLKIDPNHFKKRIHRQPVFNHHHHSFSLYRSLLFQKVSSWK